MSTVVRYNPHRSTFGPSVFDQFFNRFFDEARTSRTEDDDLAVSTWTPAADVRETEEAVTVDLELAGLKKEDIEVSLEDGVLKVSGERTFERDAEKESYQRVERFYGKFSRAFRLPRNVDGTKVKASFTDGVLSLVLPKSDEAKPRQISIN